MEEATHDDVRALDEALRQGEQDIALQRGIIARLHRRGRDTSHARIILAQLEEMYEMELRTLGQLVGKRGCSRQ